MPRWLRFLVCVLVCVVFVLPLVAMVVVAFTPRDLILDGGAGLWPSRWTTDNVTGLFDRFPVWQWFRNALLVASLTTVLSVSVNLAAGFALAKLRFRGRGLVFLLVLSTLMVPVQAIMVPQFELVARMGLIGLFWAVVLPSASTALGVFLARQFFLSVPDELLDAARMDGCTYWSAFRRVVLPLSRPLIAVMALLAFMTQWNDFLWPLITLRDPDLYTLPVALSFLQGQYDADYGGLMAMALFSCVPLLIVFVVLQRFFVAGFSRSGIR
ncbi:carbohydrate ABC transporter permease [Luteipulveratus sp. YIM 133132]|uniref:carbohydrate ABC transporter permease n=1 Tax=Luteipulveratus flavus TaxID=3031728 RepID=UPI0023B13AAA|nr:carbohydrate ABC transporter permease [Luteipulveratus sp. YIM 133132]MDE9364790.1 carbohydrate ABC transporter permease [Luteipulveratus sp. YIM 133132]